MYYVSWEEAVAFCKRLGKEFRLPTEAEWEYTCRAGSQTRFHYGDDLDYSELDQYAWYYGKSYNQTHPVGQKRANEWGLYDMYGNLSEWCLDRYPFQEGYRKAGNVDPILHSIDGWVHVTRGGSWLDKQEDCRSASRNFPSWPELLGFRVVYTGRARRDEGVLEIALPKSGGVVETSSEKELQSPRQAILGVLRDEAGLPIGEINVGIIPFQGMGLRKYANGRFEISRRPLDPNTPMQECHLIAHNKERNLAVGMQIEEDVNTLDIKLKPGVILTGRVVGSDGKEIEGATVWIKELKTGDWSGKYPMWVKTDPEGRFEFGALPAEYDYVLGARCLHYRAAYANVRSDNVRSTHMDGISIVLPRGEFSVSGVVVDASGKPVADARIWCSGEGQIGINSRTDADGKFKADGIFAGKVDVMASVQGDDGKWAGGSVSVEAGATDVRVVLGTGEWMPPPKGRACFTGETGVWANGAVVPISEVGRGQTVEYIGCDMPGASLGYIESIDEHEGAFECRDILLESGNQISVVDAHCFMLDCGRWIAAQDLRAGQRLKTMTGTVGVKSVTLRPTPYKGKVYNLKISNSDQYAVGKDGVIVRDY